MANKIGISPVVNRTIERTNPVHKQEKYGSSNGNRIDRHGFPELGFWTTLGQIYQAFFIHFGRILRLTLIPFLISTAAYIFGDLYLEATFVNSSSFTLIAIFVQAVEVVLYYFFSLAIFRLMLLGNWESQVWFDGEWRMRLFNYAFRAVTVFIPMTLFTALLLFILRVVAAYSMIATLVLAAFFILSLFAFFLRLSYALPAAAVDAPYSIADSWRATKGITLKTLFIGIFSIGPPLGVFVAVVLFLNNTLPGLELFDSLEIAYTINPSYWLITPIGMYLSYVVASFLTITVAIMFYFRTGWRPGTVRVDQHG